jgi:hypothetical protein
MLVNNLLAARSQMAFTADRPPATIIHLAFDVMVVLPGPRRPAAANARSS